MKKLVNERTLYRVNGGKWIDCSIWNKIRYYEESECKDWESKELNFADMQELIEKGFIPNAENDFTFFKKRPIIVLPSNDFKIAGYTFTEKDNNIFEIKIQYLDYNATIKTLADLLPAEHFIQYLKDRGISNCPMMK